VNHGNYYLLQDAQEDLIERANYLIEEASDPVMLEFVHQVFATARLLAGMRSMGEVCYSSSPRLSQLRRFPFKGFKDIFLLYRTVPSGVEVVRILHSRQDWLHIFR
jgi:plasmid stabilization system protein ParE